METFFPVLLLIILFAAIIYRVVSGQKIKTARRWYQETLQGNDISAALNAGRHYYSTLRSGSLTIYDEQAITNDLSAMKARVEAKNPKAATLSPSDEIARLKQQLDDGLIDEGEYRKLKNSVVSRFE